MTGEDYLIGVDLGGTKIAAGRLAGSRTLESYKKVWTKGEAGPGQVTEQIIQLVEDLLTNKKQCKGIGVGVPGFVDWQLGVINKLTNLSGWEHYPLKAILEEHFGVAVVIENDANVAAWGEFKYGNGHGCLDLLYLTVSTGIGAGIVMGGNLVRGFTGTAGEVGHMVLKPEGKRCNCGNLGCWETLSSGTAIASEARRYVAAGEKSLISDLAGGKAIKAEHVFQAYEQGDKIAGLVLDGALTYLGIGVANLVNITNPGKVVIGGGVAEAGQLVFAQIRSTVQKLGFGEAALTPILPAKLGGQAGVIGAALLALE